MNIRKSTLQDLPQILNLYKIAREFMKNNGNPNQWEDRYPEVSTVENDIKNRNFLCMRGNGGIVGTFVIFYRRGSYLPCDRKMVNGTATGSPTA